MVHFGLICDLCISGFHLQDVDLTSLPPETTENIMTSNLPTTNGYLSTDKEVTTEHVTTDTDHVTTGTEHVTSVAVHVTSDVDDVSTTHDDATPTLYELSTSDLPTQSTIGGQDTSQVTRNGMQTTIRMPTTLVYSVGS